MKRFIAIALCLVTIAYPNMALPQNLPPGYRLQCDKRTGICSMVRIQQPQIQVAAAPQVVYVRDVVAAAPVSYATFPVTPADPAPLPAATVVAASGNCGCATTGICTCAPGTCACVGCTCGATMAAYRAAPVVQYATASPYVYYSAAAPTVMQTSGGYVTTQQTDAFGNVWVSHSAGRRATRWMAKGIRRGWSN